jgi:putrescine oxidase
VGPIRWACSDLAAEGYQHVDGALRQGRLAAAEVLGAGSPASVLQGAGR